MLINDADGSYAFVFTKVHQASEKLTVRALSLPARWTTCHFIEERTNFIQE